MSPSQTATALDARLTELCRGEGFGKLVAFCRKRGVPDADAEDVAQEVVAAAFAALPTFRGESKLATWVMGIANHCCAEWQRRRRFLETLGQAPAEAPDPRTGVTSGMARAEAGQRLRQAMAGLVPLQQELLRLRFHEEIMPAQIETILRERGVVLDAEEIARRIYRALEKLEALLGESKESLILVLRR